MNLKHLETFVTIAETGSFQAAAERLFVTQSAVSMQMKALEDALQAELFDRSTRPPGLTARGRGILEQARNLVIEAQILEQAARGGSGLFGSLVIGVIPSATTTILPAALAALREQHPQLQVRVAGGLSRGLEEAVARGALDCAIVTEADRPASSLAQHTILTERLLLAAPEGAGETTPEALLAAHPFIRFNRETGIGRIIERRLQDDRLAVRETMELDSIEAILLMVSRGLGVAVVPERSLTGAFASGVRTLSFADPPLERRVGILTRAQSRQWPLVKALRDALMTAAGEVTIDRPP